MLSNKEPEEAFSALKKIKTALTNLGIEESKKALLENYIINLIIVCISDPEFKHRLNDDFPKLIEDLIRL